LLAALGAALQRSLAHHHDVVCVTRAQEALSRIVAGERFDVILSDLMMPEVTGMAMLDRLRRLSPDQARRVVFVTGGRSRHQPVSTWMVSRIGCWTNRSSSGSSSPSSKS
jgi:CheY-like chemotaxis protein